MTKRAHRTRSLAAATAVILSSMLMAVVGRALQQGPRTPGRSGEHERVGIQRLILRRLRRLTWPVATAILLAAVVLSVTAAAATGNGWFAFGQALIAPRSANVVATVNGVPLYQGDLDLAMAEATDLSGHTDFASTSRSAVLTELIRQEVAYQAAVKAGFQVSSREAAANLADQLHHGANTTAIQQLLAGTGMTLDQFINWQPAISAQQRSLTIGHYRYSVVGALLKTDPTGATAKTAWERHVDELVSAAKVVTK